MVTVPSSYVPLVTEAAQGTGLPYNLVAAQAQAESNFNASAVSSTGAEGWLQFEPTTYAPIAKNVGVPTNSEFNPADETKVYIAFMSDLLGQEHGDIFTALEAYNAGPGNLSAGASYASGIMANAGVKQGTKAGSSATTTSASGVLPLPIPGLSTILNALGIGGGGGISGDIFGTIAQDIGNTILKGLGLTSLKDLLQRLGLILMGFVLVLVGLWIMTGGTGGGQPITITQTESPDESTTTRRVNAPGVKHSKTTTTKVEGATEPRQSIRGRAGTLAKESAVAAVEA
jgi:Transglycosylase SLT domain